MALKRITTEKFDAYGKLTERVTVEEDDGVQQIHVLPAYPAAPLYPYPAGPAILPVVPGYVPPPQPFYEPPTITWGSTCDGPGSNVMAVTAGGTVTLQ